MDYQVKDALEIVLILSEEEFNYIAAAISCGDWASVEREANIRSNVTGRKMCDYSTQSKIWASITQIEQRIRRK
jgi:hypothetical protein